MMTDEDIRRGMPFFETEEEREAWRRDQGYSVSSSPETYDRIPLPEEVIDRMWANFSKPTKEEGFDEIIEINP